LQSMIISKCHVGKLFIPQLTPKEMLEAGIFGGHYFKGDIS